MKAYSAIKDLKTAIKTLNSFYPLVGNPFPNGVTAEWVPGRGWVKV